MARILGFKLRDAGSIPPFPVLLPYPPNTMSASGLEPETDGLKGQCSTIELRARSTKLTNTLWGNRTPVTAVKGQCPRPLDDGDTKFRLNRNLTVSRQHESKLTTSTGALAH